MVALVGTCHQAAPAGGRSERAVRAFPRVRREVRQRPHLSKESERRIYPARNPWGARHCPPVFAVSSPCDSRLQTCHAQRAIRAPSVLFRTKLLGVNAEILRSTNIS